LIEESLHGARTVRCNARMAELFISTEELQGLVDQTGLAVGHLMMRCVLADGCVCLWVSGWFGERTGGRRAVGVWWWRLVFGRCSSPRSHPTHAHTDTHGMPHRLMDGPSCMDRLARELANAALDKYGKAIVDSPVKVCLACQSVSHSVVLGLQSRSVQPVSQFRSQGRHHQPLVPPFTQTPSILR
jgi:hypothetical protein